MASTQPRANDEVSRFFCAKIASHCRCLHSAAGNEASRNGGTAELRLRRVFHLASNPSCHVQSARRAAMAQKVELYWLFADSQMALGARRLRL